MDSQIEVEGKYKLICSEFDKIRSFLQRMSFKEEYRVIEKDIYYNHPCKDFSRTDEALRIRIRKYLEQDKTVIALTYKGSRKLIGSGIKARREIEVELRDWKKLDEILVNLGFSRAISFVKERIIYKKDNAEVTIDHVYGLGQFMEIEAGDQAIIEKIYSGLRECLQPINKTYLELCMETQRCEEDFDES